MAVRKAWVRWKGSVVVRGMETLEVGMAGVGGVS